MNTNLSVEKIMEVCPIRPLDLLLKYPYNIYNADGLLWEPPIPYLKLLLESNRLREFGKSCRSGVYNLTKNIIDNRINLQSYPEGWMNNMHESAAKAEVKAEAYEAAANRSSYTEVEMQDAASIFHTKCFLDLEDLLLFDIWSDNQRQILKRLGGPITEKESEIEEEKLSISNKPEPKKRQDAKDHEAVLDFVRQKIEETPNTLPTVIELARLAKKEESGRSYGLTTLKRWIGPVHPQYTPGKPGRKKSTQSK